MTAVSTEERLEVSRFESALILNLTCTLSTLASFVSFRKLVGVVVGSKMATKNSRRIMQRLITFVMMI